MGTKYNMLKRIYMVYGMFAFGLIFLILFILFLIPIFFSRLSRITYMLNRWWCRSLFVCIAMPWHVVYRFPIHRRKPYIFCPNHFSWLDIPTLGLNRHNMIFVGKSEIGSVPLFGWMYKKLHLVVNRNSLNSMHVMLRKASHALDAGKSLCIFPEGGIRTHKLPQMAPFKAGAFHLAIEKQIPIVPVTIPNNWIILPNKSMLLTWKRVKVIFHEPIMVKGMTLEDVDTLKERVYEVIASELKRQCPDTL